MSLRFYLAMTEAEIRSATSLPRHLAYMACHFSPYGIGLTNIPKQLPPGSILIVNDRVPVLHHDPAFILRQLTSAVQKLNVFGILLDFQIYDVPMTAQIVKTLVNGLPCPVAVSAVYGKELSCPIFTAPALHQRFCDFEPIKKGRPLWLDAYQEAALYKVTSNGCTISKEARLSGKNFFDEVLQCRYSFSVERDSAAFTLSRQAEEITGYLHAAEKAGISVAVGLYQQFSQTDTVRSVTPSPGGTPTHG